jgi:Hpt domain
MNTPTGRLQFFALEAGDYLERLALIAGRETRPNGDELVRLSRALRGAALMAGLAPFSQAAAGLEQVAKALRDGQWPWDAGHREIVADAVEELKRLTRQAETWNDADTGAALALGRGLVAALGTDQLAAARPEPAETTDELPASVRAFVAREGALVAGSLEHAAQAAELGPVDERADLVLHRLQPLRGLATLPALSPLPELLDAIELTIRSLRDDAIPPGSATGLRAAAAAVSRLAREIAERGEADVEAPEIAGAATALLHTFASEADVVDIEALFAEGDLSPIVQRGEPAAPEAGPDPTIELVGFADRLRQAADQLGAAGLPAARDLHLYSLAVQLRPLAQETRRERPYLTPLVDAVTGAIRRGAASDAASTFADRLREAADHLGRASENRNAVFLTDDLADVVAALESMPGGAVPPPVILPEPPDLAMPEAELVEIAELEVETVEIASLDFEAAEPEPVQAVNEPDVVPIESLAPAEAEPMTAFERSFSTWYRLEHAAEPAAPPPSEPASVRSAVEPAPERPPVAAPPGLELDVVPIESLLYGGRRALERADVVRRELSGALARHQAFSDVEPLVSELIDLVPLALAE